MFAQLAEQGDAFGLHPFLGKSAVAGKTVLQPELVEGVLRGALPKGAKVAGQPGIVTGDCLVNEMIVARQPGDAMLSHEARNLLQCVRPRCRLVAGLMRVSFLMRDADVLLHVLPLRP
ncbi:hypothetical protein GCM10007920_23080 [Ciceribacter naphthalenivorans]|uniref:Uncharacterized protein n=2 Tax=Alphaproteobacteria TaxID=28211 RepID=A0A512HGH6_9HYPH|nr:hypothetical protein RNA01_14900 [Ciceribacter naphthalenivorans]GLR22521.1 hypothetical protein GCM10007920_23080 [Ciceribacter naphthalenivorans]GLT05377.1 hypothetical protein GCM10007926_23080 [Sphingomonas psychrolutea]